MLAYDIGGANRIKRKRGENVVLVGRVRCNDDGGTLYVLYRRIVKGNAVFSRISALQHGIYRRVNYGVYLSYFSSDLFLFMLRFCRGVPTCRLGDSFGCGCGGILFHIALRFLFAKLRIFLHYTIAADNCQSEKRDICLNARTPSKNGRE